MLTLFIEMARSHDVDVGHMTSLPLLYPFTHTHPPPLPPFSPPPPPPPPQCDHGTNVAVWRHFQDSILHPPSFPKTVQHMWHITGTGGRGHPPPGGYLQEQFP